MNEKIKTLQDIELKQEKLKILMKVTTQEFSSSIGTNKKELQGFVLKNIGIPVGILGFGKLAIDQFSNSKNNMSNSSNNSSQGFFSFILKLIPVVLSLVKSKEIIENTTTATK